MKPRILVSASANFSVYSALVNDAGGIAEVSYLPKIDTSFDGLLLCGGNDSHPKFYGEEINGAVDIDLERDEAELALTDAFVKAGKPILGICRGMQALNVFCGGSMIQDIPSEYETKIIHRLDKPEIAFHKILVEKSSPLSEIMGFGEHLINSYHHQAVKEVAPDFSVCATAEDGIIEAIYHKNKKFILGVQWHPERDQETATGNKKIIDSFVKICSK